MDNFNSGNKLEVSQATTQLNLSSFDLQNILQK